MRNARRSVPHTLLLPLLAGVWACGATARNPAEDAEFAATVDAAEPAVDAGLPGDQSAPAPVDAAQPAPVDAARPAVDVLQGSDNPHLSLTVAADGVGETVPGVISMRFAAPIFFGNAQTLSTSIRRAVNQAPHAVSAFILDMEAVTDVDITGAETLAKDLQWLQAKGITFAYSRVRPKLLANLERMHLLQGHNVFDTNRAAVAALRPPAPPPRR